MEDVKAPEGSGGTVRDDLTTSLARSVAAMVKRPPEEISGSTRFHQDLDFDSTDVLELLMRLEADFDIEFDPDSFEAGVFETVDSLAAHVRGILGD